MNICIVTVYNTENCGSFWQAYALGDVLKRMGHKVSYFYRDKSDTSSALKSHLRECAAKAVKLRICDALFVWNRRHSYKKAQKCFNVIKEGSKEYEEVDCFVLGSDTIWNFSEPYFLRHKDIYTGSKFEGRKCISYAASAANTPFEVFEKDEEIRNAIGKLEAISLRDNETLQIVKKLINREGCIVCDPTMLSDASMYEKHIKKIDRKNYILIYSFAKFKEKDRNEILDLAKKHSLDIISFGEHRSWCDKTIPYDPYDFISYIKNAEFVITDTFHGTIFSIIFEKKFAEYGNRKKKISDLLYMLSLTDTVRENREALEDIYLSDIGYESARMKIDSLRRESVEYLRENILEN